MSLAAFEMEAYFRELSARLFASLHADEVMFAGYEGERSDFVRINQSRIRQAGRVRQQFLELNLIHDGRQLNASLSLTGQLDDDLAQAKFCLKQMRERLPFLPRDPFLSHATERFELREVTDNELPPSRQAVEAILAAADGLDLVGLWSGGELVRGLAGSVGQYGWHRQSSFNFDWSVYHQADKASKQSCAGAHWDSAVALRQISVAREDLAMLAKPPRTIQPGRYRVFLSPSAMFEILTLLNWGGFGLKSHRTQQTPLLRMVKEGVELDGRIHLTEDHAGGLTPRITRRGFVKPERVELISAGRYRDCLANSRSAKEYGVAVNCAIEHPESLVMQGGQLPRTDVLRALDTGIYISNLWYCNYSDRNHCRITGMTRFACFWVEDGKPVAPINVMRFDESLFDVLGDKLVDLTVEQDYIVDSTTYGKRSENSARLPGALVDDFRFTL